MKTRAPENVSEASRCMGMGIIKRNPPCLLLLQTHLHESSFLSFKKRGSRFLATKLEAQLDRDIKQTKQLKNGPCPVETGTVVTG